MSRLLLGTAILLAISCKKKTSTTTTQSPSITNNKVFNQAVFVSSVAYDTIKINYLSAINSNSNEYSISNFYYTVAHGNHILSGTTNTYTPNAILNCKSLESGLSITIDNSDGNMSPYGNGAIGSNYAAFINNNSMSLIVKRIK